MNKVYTLLVEKYDALDGYITSIDVKTFADKKACYEWMAEEIERQAEQGFRRVPHEEDPAFWEFTKEKAQGMLSHEFYGQYRDVIGGVANDETN